MKFLSAIYFLPLFFFTLLIHPLKGQFSLETFASGFDQPIGIANADDGRLFIIERSGVIQVIFADGSRADAPFLDIKSIVSDNQSERGLLGLAFHPNFNSNGYFFVNYINNAGNTVISRFSASEDRQKGLPNSEKEILSFEQPFWNHNGGDLHFGADGFLYISSGDGGSGGDPFNNSQNRLSFLGKLLRIDIDNGDPYSIPDSNPFSMDDGTLDEIWALGLRNPWRFSFDRMTNDLWIGDVGQDSWEEIDFQPADSEGGENYGWNCREGNHLFTNDCNQSSATLIDPIWEYQNSNASGQGCSVTGGYVYRGSQQPSLFGKYIYADFCSGRFWSLEQDINQVWINNELLNGSNNSFSAFGEDRNGELFVANVNGTIERVIFDCSSPDFSFAVGPSCIGSSDGSITLFHNLTNAIFSWNNGMSGAIINELEPGTYTVTIEDNSCLYERSFDVVSIIPPLVEIQDFNYCESDSVIAVANTPDGYVANWYMEDLLVSMEDELIISAPGNYGLAFVGECSTAISHFTVTEIELPDVNISQNGNVLSVSTDFEFYQWFLDGVEIVGADGPDYTATVNGTYTVLVEDPSGCTILSEELEVTMVNIFEKNGDNIKINPNPFGDFIRVSNARGMYQIIDVSGVIALQGSLESLDFKIATDQLSSGLYLIKIISPVHAKSYKMIKQ